MGSLFIFNLKEEVHRLIRVKRYSEITGIITFDCPFCNDTRGRGWVSLTSKAAGCWNAGCSANPRIPGGAHAWIRVMRRRQQILGEAISILEPQENQKAQNLEVISVKPAYDEAKKIWGLNRETVKFYHLKLIKIRGYDRLCPWRIHIPVLGFGGENLGYQLRLPAFYPDVPNKPPKYTAQKGSSLSKKLFGLHALAYAPNNPAIVLLEGAGDVMRWWQDFREKWNAIPLGLFGQNLSTSQLDIIARIRPRKIFVALDADASKKSLSIAERLRQWLVPHTTEAVLWGTWDGAKDAGDGGNFVVLGNGRGSPLTSGLQVILGNKYQSKNQ